MRPFSPFFSPVSYFIADYVSLFFPVSFAGNSSDRLSGDHYSPHSFRRGDASFAFRCNVPAEHIQRQDDWQSDANLVYLQMSSAQKRQAVNFMAAQILLLSRSSH